MLSGIPLQRANHTNPKNVLSGLRSQLTLPSHSQVTPKRAEP
jgi:hypothetical protein